MPPTIRRVTVEVFDPASAREYDSFVKVKVDVTLRLTVSQSVSQSWCRAQSGVHDHIFIAV
jgi:hypothetical protein